MALIQHKPGIPAGLFREADERELVELLRDYRCDESGKFGTLTGFAPDSLPERDKVQRLLVLLERLGTSVDQFMREKGHPDYQEPPETA